MRQQGNNLRLKPSEYELAVKKLLDAAARPLPIYESSHLEKIPGLDGDYVIDVAARFSVLGASFLVLVECKRQGRNVEREQVQAFHSKLKSAGAHKGIVFATSGFQRGAIEYADAHGIGLVKFAGDETTWLVKSASPISKPLSGCNSPKYVGWWCHGEMMSVLSEDHTEYTRQILGIL